MTDSLWGLMQMVAAVSAILVMLVFVIALVMGLVRAVRQEKANADFRRELRKYKR
ncbi:hypothetical protein LHJ74_30840 [Streptomyces sp. N2-109]|uniref:DUF4083 domain-containing protein n=1 Tax=Streptomyces gossypii TaxID=2883101 RepID=A0ABT2K256_9ACTN|nr:hypothetical protein [Streptomyces gossypii]MCT2594254.1 hypothetical protein [Streptomyces gossypii]